MFYFQQSISFNMVKLLIGLVFSYPLEQFEKRISEAFVYVQSGVQQQIIR